MNAKAAFPGPCLGDLCLILLDSLWGRREVWICNGERNPHCSCLENRDDREFRNYVVEIPCCWKLPVDALLSRPPCICFSSQRVRLSAALTPEVIVPRTAKGRIARRDPRVDIVVIVQERKKDFGRTRTRTSPPQFSWYPYSTIQHYSVHGYDAAAPFWPSSPRKPTAVHIAMKI
jgi:hypothetical protein